MLKKSLINIKLNKKKKILNVYLNKHLIISQKLLNQQIKVYLIVCSLFFIYIFY